MLSTAASNSAASGRPRLAPLSKRKERERSTQAGSVSSLPAYSELYSPTGTSGGVKGLGITRRESEDGQEEQAEVELTDAEEDEAELVESVSSLAVVAGPATLGTSPGISRAFLMPPRTVSGTFTSYHLSLPRPVLPSSSSDAANALDDASSSSDDDGPETQLDRLLQRSSSALATAQSLLSGTLGGRGGLLDQEERGREGEDALRRVEVETRLRIRRNDEHYSNRIDPLFASIANLLTDMERHASPHSSYAALPLRSRLNPVGASLGTVQLVEAAPHHSSAFTSTNSSPSTSKPAVTRLLPSSPNGAPDHVEPPPRSPATSLLSSLHTRTSSVSSSKSFFLSPPPQMASTMSSPRTPTGFSIPTPASSPPTQTRFPSSVRTTPTSSTTAFSSPPQPRSSYPTPTLHPSPSLDRILPTPSTSAAQLSVSPSSRPRTMSSHPALGRPDLTSLSPMLNLPSSHRPISSASSSSLRSTSVAPSEQDEDEENAIETLADFEHPPHPPSAHTARHKRSLSPLPPTSFGTSPSPTAVSATTTPTMSTVSLPAASPAPAAAVKAERSPSAPGQGQVGSAVLGEGSAAMRRLRTLGAVATPTPVQAPEDGAKPAPKWGSGWFGGGS